MPDMMSPTIPGLPVWADYAEPYGVKNLQGSSFFPSAVGPDSLTYRYFIRILLQMAMAPAKVKLPEDWPINYFLYMLYCVGFGAITYTDEYGIIFNGCTLSGYDIYYQPKYISINNPLLPSSKYQRLEVGKDAALIRLRPDYGSIMDTVCYYAGQLATAAGSLNVNLINSKMAYVFACDNKTIAESFKKLYDDVASGSPASFADKKLFDAEGNLKVQLFQQDLSTTFIGLDILEAMRTLMNSYMSTVGIPNANITKRERLNRAEVSANDFETAAIPLVSEEVIQRDIDTAINLYPELSGKLSFELRKETVSLNDNATADPDAIRAMKGGT